MTFTLDIWQEQTTQKLQQIRQWLADRKGRDLPYVVYGAFSTMALWPLVKATQPGQLLPAACNFNHHKLIRKESL